MARSFNKTAVDLKLPAQVDSIFLYVGARTVMKHITKSKLISVALDAACNNQSASLYGDTERIYSFSELRDIGKKTIHGTFQKLIEKEEVRFLEEMDGYEVPETDNNDEIYRSLAIQILKRHMFSINLRNTDYEDIIKVVLISEDDLKISSEGEGGVGSYVFLKEAQPYTVYHEMKKIVGHYNDLRSIKETYLQVLSLFDKVLNRLATDLGYSWESRGDQKYYEVFDGNLDFYKASSKALHEVEFKDFMTEKELNDFKRQYMNMLRLNDKLKKMKNCSSECEECIFDVRKCVDRWLKRHFEGLIENLCFIDGFNSHSSAWANLEDELFSKKYEGIYVFKKI